MYIHVYMYDMYIHVYMCIHVHVIHVYCTVLCTVLHCTAVWYSSGVRPHYSSSLQTHCSTVVLRWVGVLAGLLWYCGTVVLWYCGTVVLWYCITVSHACHGHDGSFDAELVLHEW